MDMDLGIDITPEMKAGMARFDEQDDRIYIGTSDHDMTLGCYVSGPDSRIHSVADNTLLYGNLQDESYFGRYIEDIKGWLHVKPEYDSHEYTSDDLCIINMRGGEYTSCPQLYLDRSYWLKAIRNMKKIDPGMRFMIVTEDEEAARKVLPEYECHHFDMGKDYVTIKNARYLILSNSSFAIMAAMTSDELKYAIAPKYWARHNVSDGFWSSEQNIYSFLHYQDRKGKLFTPEECRRELSQYKQTSALYARRNTRPGKIMTICQHIRKKALAARFFALKMLRSFERRTGIIKTFSGS